MAILNGNTKLGVYGVVSLGTAALLYVVFNFLIHLIEFQGTFNQQSITVISQTNQLVAANKEILMRQTCILVSIDSLLRSRSAFVITKRDLDMMRWERRPETITNHK